MTRYIIQEIFQIHFKVVSSFPLLHLPHPQIFARQVEHSTSLIRLLIPKLHIKKFFD